jgi:Flp pilus assembly pilin Flp
VKAVVALYRDTRGIASVEYVIVLSLVSVGAALAVIALGPRLLELFLLQRSILLSPIP